MVDLIQVATMTSRIRSFLEVDLPTLLTECDLRAAANALVAARGAADQRSALWSVLNHLEAAEAKYELGLTGLMRAEAAQAIFYLQGVRALILLGLEDHGLVQGCFNRCVAIAEIHNANQRRAGLRDVLAANNPANWLRMYRSESSAIGKAARAFDVYQFWHELGYCDYDASRAHAVYDNPSPFNLEVPTSDMSGPGL